MLCPYLCVSSNQFGTNIPSELLDKTGKISAVIKARVPTQGLVVEFDHSNGGSDPIFPDFLKSIEV